MSTKKAARKAAGTNATNAKHGGLLQGIITLAVGIAIVVMGATYVPKGGVPTAVGIGLDALGVFIVAMGVVQCLVVFSDRRRKYGR